VLVKISCQSFFWLLGRKASRRRVNESDASWVGDLSICPARRGRLIQELCVFPKNWEPGGEENNSRNGGLPRFRRKNRNSVPELSAREREVNAPHNP